MKKLLLGTSALLVAGFVSSSLNAAPIKLNVGGYANWYTGYVDGNNDYENGKGDKNSDFPIVGDVEIAFSGETALTNGVKFGAVVEVKSVGNVPNKEQSFIYVESGLGRVAIGLVDSISKQLHTASKDVGLLTSQASDISFLSNLGGTLSTDMRESDGGSSIVYMSPKFYGFGLAASYSEKEFTSWQTNDGNNNAVYMAVATYNGKVSSLDISADLGYAKMDSGAIYAEDYAISAGLRIGMNGFTLGGGYKLVKADGIGIGNNTVFDIGLAYEQGPYGASLSYIYGNNELLESQEIKDSLLLASVSYDVTAGVKTFASFGYQTYENSIKDGKQKAYTFATGLGLAF